MSKSFKEWLKMSRYTKIDTMRDDIVRDILQDVAFPDASDEATLLAYMESRPQKPGPPSILLEFKDLYASYLAYMNSNH